MLPPPAAARPDVEVPQRIRTHVQIALSRAEVGTGVGTDERSS